MDLFLYLCSVIKKNMGKSPKATRLIFGLDALLLSKQLDFVNDEDPRNQRASDLIKRASILYIQGGRKYEDLINDVGDNAFGEYQEWYKKNIFDVVKNSPEHLSPDRENVPFPKYDVKKYEFDKYFDGLNKEVFEELQKMVMFLFDPRSEEILERESSDEDEDFVNHTRHFSVLGHSILIATLEGKEFLDRLEKIIHRYDVGKEFEEAIMGAAEGRRKNKVNESITEIASDLLKMKPSYN
jgi:hypothetical protein